MVTTVRACGMPAAILCSHHCGVMIHLTLVPVWHVCIRRPRSLNTICPWATPCTVHKAKAMCELTKKQWTYLITLRKSHVLTLDRKSTRLNSSHVRISYAVFCL